MRASTRAVSDPSVASISHGDDRALFFVVRTKKRAALAWIHASEKFQDHLRAPLAPPSSGGDCASNGGGGASEPFFLGPLNPPRNSPSPGEKAPRKQPQRRVVTPVRPSFRGTSRENRERGVDAGGSAAEIRCHLPQANHQPGLRGCDLPIVNKGAARLLPGAPPPASREKEIAPGTHGRPGVHLPDACFPRLRYTRAAPLPRQAAVGAGGLPGTRYSNRVLNLCGNGQGQPGGRGPLCRAARALSRPRTPRCWPPGLKPLPRCSQGLCSGSLVAPASCQLAPDGCGAQGCQKSASSCLSSLSWSSKNIYVFIPAILPFLLCVLLPGS